MAGTCQAPSCDHAEILGAMEDSFLWVLLARDPVLSSATCYHLG